MRIGFRLDANAHVASGHMMRCVAIAKELMKQGHTVLVVLAEEKNTEYLAAQGIEYKVINGHWNDWDADMEKVTNVVLDEQLDVLVVDSYVFTPVFLETLNRIVPVFLLDDICDTRYEVSAVLHYSEFPGENLLKNLYRGTKVKVFAGMKYTPLRLEFVERPARQRKQQIMITTGGTDPYHISLHLVEMLAGDKRFVDWDILVVCGKMNTDYEKIALMRLNTSNLQVLQNASNMAELMCESEIAVSAGGITIYELCCSRTAIVGFSFSDDQAILLKKFARHDILLYSGDARDDENAVVLGIYEGIANLVEDRDKRNRLIHRSHNLADGYGARRIAQKIIEVANTV